MMTDKTQWPDELTWVIEAHPRSALNCSPYLVDSVLFVPERFFNCVRVARKTVAKRPFYVVRLEAHDEGTIDQLLFYFIEESDAQFHLALIKRHYWDDDSVFVINTKKIIYLSAEMLIDEGVGTPFLIDPLQVSRDDPRLALTACAQVSEADCPLLAQQKNNPFCGNRMREFIQQQGSVK